MPGSSARSSVCSSTRSSCSASSGIPPASPQARRIRVSDVELASRLSFFLWNSIPDDQLLDLAARGQLRRAGAFSNVRFGGCWPTPRRQLARRQLRCAVAEPPQSRGRAAATRIAFRSSTRTCAAGSPGDRALHREHAPGRSQHRGPREPPTTRSSTNALAEHYGIPGVYGQQFRRVTFKPGEPARRPARAGQHPDHLVASQPHVARAAGQVAAPEHARHRPARASGERAGPPGTRGKAARRPPVRQLLERHRPNPACASCHAPIDPLGLALENFDAIGRWRADRRRRADRRGGGDAGRGALRRTVRFARPVVGSTRRCSSEPSPRSCSPMRSAGGSTTTIGRPSDRFCGRALRATTGGPRSCSRS